MSDHDVRADVLTALPADDSMPADLREPASALTRVIARLCAYQLDRRLAAGEVPAVGSALAVHLERLTSRRERLRLAATLREVLHDAQEGGTRLSPRVRVDRAAAVAAVDAIESIVLRLDGPRPVRACGMARLRLMLADGAGPMYAMGRGDLAGALRLVLAGL